MHYGVYNSISGAGAGNKYGSYNHLDLAAGGTHYGIYSEALKAGSFAGYFLGDVYLGTTSVNGYKMPNTDGLATYVLQTDGLGQASWVDPITLPGGGGGDTDWTIVGNDVYKSIGR